MARFLVGQPFRRITCRDLVELGPGDYVRFVIERPYVLRAIDTEVDLIMLVNYPSE